MKNDAKQSLFVEERHRIILQMLRDQSKVLVQELCDYFGLSPATIRNDLRELEEKGELRRTHGGAILPEKAGFEPGFLNKRVARIGQKKAMAQKALDLIEDGDSIALDSSSTTIMEMTYLLAEKKHLTIVTNCIKQALYLEEHTDATVVLIGGTMRRGFSCTTGSLSVAEISKLNVDKAFMAANAFSIDRGFTTPNLEQAEVKGAFLSIASQRIMLMDSGKVGQIRFIKFAGLEDFDIFVTDKLMDQHVVDYIHERYPNLELILA